MLSARACNVFGQRCVRHPTHIIQEIQEIGIQSPIQRQSSPLLSVLPTQKIFVRLTAFWIRIRIWIWAANELNVWKQKKRAKNYTQSSRSLASSTWSCCPDTRYKIQISLSKLEQPTLEIQLKLTFFAKRETRKKVDVAECAFY